MNGIISCNNSSYIGSCNRNMSSITSCNNSSYISSSNN